MLDKSLESEKTEVFMCYFIFHVALFFLVALLLSSYFINRIFLLAAPCLVLVMYLSYKKGKGEKIRWF